MSNVAVLQKAFIRSRRARGRNDRTIVEYEGALEHLRKYLSADFTQLSITTIDRPTLEDFLISFMAAGRTSTTANKVFRSLRAFFNWCEDEEYIERTPFTKKFVPPQAHPSNKAGYKPAEVQAQIDNLRDELSDGARRERFLAVRDLALLLVLYDTGLRAKELLAMCIEKIDWETGHFAVPAKGGKTRSARLGKASRAAVEAYIKSPRFRAFSIIEGPLWRNFGGYYLTVSGLHRLCRRRAEDAGVKGGHPHRWRYTHSEVLQDLGWPEEVIMAEMGHSVLSVSRQYRQAAIRRRALKLHEEQSPADLLERGG